MEKNLRILTCVAIGIVALILIIFISKNVKYNKGIECFNNKNWDCTISNLQGLSYKDSDVKYNMARYGKYLTDGDNDLKANRYESALSSYRKANNIKTDNENLKAKIKSLETIVNIKKQKEEETRRKAQEEQERKRIKAKISEGAIYPIPTKFGEGYDNTIRRYGVATIKRINKLAPIAAELIVQNPRCTRLSIIDVADDRSTKNKITFFADCCEPDNIAAVERFYISEDEIAAKTTPKSVKQKMENREVEYLNLCEAHIKSELTFPSTYKSNPLLNDVSTRPMGTLVRINFSAKNVYNLEAKFIGNCTFNDNGLADINIQEKQ